MNEIAICVNIGSSSIKIAAFNLSNNKLINDKHFNLSTETENHKAEIYKRLEEFINLVDKAKIKFISHIFECFVVAVAECTVTYSIDCLAQQ